MPCVVDLDARSRGDVARLLAELLQEAGGSPRGLHDDIDSFVAPLSLFDCSRNGQRLGYHLGVELPDMCVLKPLCVGARFGEDAGQAWQAGKGEEHGPVVLRGRVSDRAERGELGVLEVLSFVDEDGQPGALLIGGIGEVVDELRVFPTPRSP